jgi:hypothetical protein
MTKSDDNDLLQQQRDLKVPDGGGNMATGCDDSSSLAAPKEASNPPLPLGWTRVKRKRSEGVAGDGSAEDCCEDPSCLRRRRAPLSSATAQPTTTAMDSNPNGVTFRGKAVFCLQDSNPDWFQGYFFHQQETTGDTAASLMSSSTRKAWGLLCEQQELDDCLQCAEGGYRVLRLTVYPFGGGQVRTPKKVVIPDVEWTGGDMMRLLHADGRVNMDPQQLLTDQKAVPFVKGIFGSLLHKLKALRKDEPAEQDEESGGVLELLPDVAIVMGTMEIILPPPPIDENTTSLS